MNGIIYMYTSPSGKQYIGQTINEYHRRYHHAKAPTKSAFHAAVNKYGIDAFKYEILHKGIKSKKILNLLETLEIISRNTLAHNGYNLNTGGDSRLASPEARARLSAVHSNSRRPHRDKPVFCIETGEYFCNRTSAAEAHNIDISKISEVTNNYERTAGGCHWFTPGIFKEQNRPMLKYNPNNNQKMKKVQQYETGIIFNSLREAAISLGKPGIRGAAIGTIIDNPEKTLYGYHWVTPGTSYKSISKANDHPTRRRSVICVETGNIYSSLKEAAKHFKVSHSNIINAIKKNGKSGGYHWKYV